MTVYKIRNRMTGHYSTGGTYPHWSTKGKMWMGAGPVSNHIGLVKKGFYQFADVVAFELTEGNLVSVEEWEEALSDRKQKRKLQQTIAAVRNKREELERHIETLRKQLATLNK